MSHVLVFDLDDTLFPEYSFVLSGFEAVDAWLLEHRGIQGFYAVASMLFEAGERGTIFNQALEQIGLPASPEFVQGLVRVYREHRPQLSLYDDAARALAHYQGRYRLGLITDGYLVTQRNKVAALGIAEYFSVIVYSDEHGREYWKPHEKPYRRCMEALDCSGGDCTYVGDNPTKDFVTARALGWRTIQISRDRGEYSSREVFESHRPHHNIRSLDELKDLLP